MFPQRRTTNNGDFPEAEQCDSLILMIGFDLLTLYYHTAVDQKVT